MIYLLQIGAQDIQEKFWEVIDALDVNMVLRWFRNNIVFTIIVFSWSETANCYDLFRPGTDRISGLIRLGRIIRPILADPARSGIRLNKD